MKEVLEFNHKKQCGLWLTLIGVVLIVAAVFGGSFLDSYVRCGSQNSLWSISVLYFKTI
ncbi:DUF6609 family protein [Butyrivibrio sp. AC2005]|uniref:DUF6609 family protein n=1 Tax=Butyrivibrio sp. AC2005 TaxID=1280672 RepID=UPI002FE5444A